MNNFFYNVRLRYDDLNKNQKIGLGALLLVVIIVLLVVILTTRKSPLDPASITINPDATPILVQGYPAWICNQFKFNVQDGMSYGELHQQVLTTLNDWRTRKPLQELLPHYTNEKDRLVALANLFDEGNDRDLIEQDPEKYVLLLREIQQINNHYANLRQQIILQMSVQVRDELFELGCLLY